jgi:hypothetical protein
MVYTFHLTEQDFIDFQLYVSSKSESIQRKKVRQMVILTAMFGVLGVLSYVQSNLSSAKGFGLVALATLIFYPM